MFKGEDTNFRVYLAGLKKVGNPSKQPLNPERLYWKMDEQLEQKTRHSKKVRKGVLPTPRDNSPEVIERFSHTRINKPIDELVRGAVGG